MKNGPDDPVCKSDVAIVAVMPLICYLFLLAVLSTMFESLQARVDRLEQQAHLSAPDTEPKEEKTP